MLTEEIRTFLLILPRIDIKTTATDKARARTHTQTPTEHAEQSRSSTNKFPLKCGGEKAAIQAPEAFTSNWGNAFSHLLPTSQVSALNCCSTKHTLKRTTLTAAETTTTINATIETTTITIYSLRRVSTSAVHESVSLSRGFS